MPYYLSISLTLQLQLLRVYTIPTHIVVISENMESCFFFKIILAAMWDIRQLELASRRVDIEHAIKQNRRVEDTKSLDII